MERQYDVQNPVHCARLSARERFSFPGGYELCIITTDGGLICSSCARKEYRNIIHSTKHEVCDGWRVRSIINESELEDEFCSHCSKPLGYHEDCYDEV